MARRRSTAGLSVGGIRGRTEPTGLAILALCRNQLAGHPRIADGVRWLLARSLASGGWNTEEATSSGPEPYAHAGPTGIILLALRAAGLARDRGSDAGLPLPGTDPAAGRIAGNPELGSAGILGLATASRGGPALAASILYERARPGRFSHASGVAGSGRQFGDLPAPGCRCGTRGNAAKPT